MSAIQALARHQRARGTGRIATQVLDGRTRLTTLFQEGCAKIRLPHTHDPSLQAVLINTAGGLTGGDEVSWDAKAAPGARMVLTTQACERVYRSLGDDATVSTRLEVGAGAHLDWLPQETILYEGGRLNRSLEVDLAPDASFFAIEAIILGREAMGEAARGARLSDSWRIRRDGRLLHAEATRLSTDPLERDGLSLLAGAGAFATLLYVGTDAERKLDPVRALTTGQSAASVIGERLVVRAMAPSGLALRRIITPIIAKLSGAGTLPRLWHL
ncbi:urease accessory protein UreD [Devosia insulae DS-56]|uniref:Urease accessory protein UreD n=1 Tax=Devosia insulae DS-56 TaxID=1116389 RepID=A0A1E5XU20_9HYPH|nr:urease accessory protein UreD [Devosia insulae]OEO32099.1 urease accessory protein UreD [Devosia insulae DS-56]